MTHLTWGAATDVGAVRSSNQDSVLAEAPVFAVADGMGGHAAGEVASALVVASLSELVGRQGLTEPDVVAALAGANRKILDWAAEHAESSGLGTTVTGVCATTGGGVPHWIVFNVGDSRVYRYGASGLKQVTTDHSEAAQLVAAGQLTPEQAQHYLRRNVITRSLGSDPPPTVDVWVLPATPGETMLACSDGLTNEVDDQTIAATLADGLDPQAAADALCKMAVENGGHDNVSVVIARLSA